MVAFSFSQLSFLELVGGVNIVLEGKISIKDLYDKKCLLMRYKILNIYPWGVGIPKLRWMFSFELRPFWCPINM